ncbi:MAG: hypothetical protein VX694_10500 [Planctomycetota bacterium]|nr:hypothetical protein [Planctomycetota bacterium]
MAACGLGVASDRFSSDEPDCRAMDPAWARLDLASGSLARSKLHGFEVLPADYTEKSDPIAGGTSASNRLRFTSRQSLDYDSEITEAKIRGKMVQAVQVRQMLA